MIYKEMPKIPSDKELLDRAFKKASATAEKLQISDKRTAFRIRDFRRIEVSRDVIVKSFEQILEKTPDFDAIPIFYQELLKTIIDVDDFRKSLGSLRWAANMTIDLAEKYKIKLKGAQIRDMNRIRREFYGRISSVLKQLRKNLIFLEECRLALKNLPKFKEIPTFIIAGPPNVGKSSLLSILTGAEPDIQSYPFTTKSIMVGNISGLVQFVDTPGLLDREISSRNSIEKKSVVALKHLSDKIIFVFDPTETCGYSIKQQINIFTSVKKEFKAKMTVVINKTDMDYKKDNLAKITSLSKDHFRISAKNNIGIDRLRVFVLKGTFPGKEKFYKK